MISYTLNCTSLEELEYLKSIGVLGLSVPNFSAKLLPHPRWTLPEMCKLYQEAKSWAAEECMFVCVPLCMTHTVQNSVQSLHTLQPLLDLVQHAARVEGWGSKLGFGLHVVLNATGKT